jgi:dihydrodipicolinate synthase/N-acetylneuraminate lyase
MYAIAHIGTTSQLDAIALAQHALADGADAIASVPPFYEK